MNETGYSEKNECTIILLMVWKEKINSLYQGRRKTETVKASVEKKVDIRKECGKGK